MKVEIDTRPPAGAETETRLVRRFVMLNLLHYDRASLLAGKLETIDWDAALRDVSTFLEREQDAALVSRSVLLPLLQSRLLVTAPRSLIGNQSKRVQQGFPVPDSGRRVVAL